MQPENSPSTIKPLSQILATPGLLQPPAPTTTSSQGGSGSTKKKQDWLNKWLKLNPHCYQLKVALDQVYDICTQYAKNPSVGRTIVIYGENGCGKSTIAKSVTRWATAIGKLLKPVINSQTDEFSQPVCMFVNWPKVVDNFKPPLSDYAIVSDMEAAHLLVIDDVGAEHDPSKIGVEKLYIALNRREHRWNIITTNISPDQWQAKFERRVSSRLFRNAQHIDLSLVPDYSTI